ncbi:MAG: WD40 repeat domain-containing protein [Thermodesulfobacteriota bacterium]
MLRQVCEEIAGAYNTSLTALLREGEDDKKLGTYGGMREIFSRCLALATEDLPLLIFLDALDQLQSGLFDFLPHNLPDPVRIVVSALPELEDRLSFAEVYRLPLMAEPDGEALLGAWLDVEGRRLTGEQWNEVIGKFSQNGLPLYLKLAFEQARHWHSYDHGKVLPADVDGILAGYFGLLEKEHTPALVGKVTGYLLSGKYRGLTEAEILDILVFDQEYWESFVKGSHPAHRAEIEEIKRLPFVVWSRLFLDLEPYLSERNADGLPIITFYHGKFREYAGERYLAIAADEKIPPYPPLGKGGLEEGGDLAMKFHATLASYFESLPLYLDAPEQNPNIRKVVEQPYQETMAGRWEVLADTCLADFQFLMAKAKAAMVEGILEDYRLAFERLPQEWREKLRFWEAFFRERAHILRRGNEDWPSYKILLQLALEHADDSPVTEGAELYLAGGKCDWPWLRRERRPEQVGIDPCLAVLEGHNGGIEEALVLPDGRILSWAFRDATLRLWDQAGKPLAVFEGHTDWVSGALALADGRILSWSQDNCLRLWDQAGKPLAVLEGHTESVSGALALADGRILSWSWDTTLRLWDQSGKLMAVLEGHTDVVERVLELSDGRILSWALSFRFRDATLRLWTLRLWDRAGKPLAVLEGHTLGVKGALLLPDGRILSWSRDKTLRLWDRSGKPLTVLVGHTSNVDGALALPDGRILSWSRDKTLRLWDQDGKSLAVMEGHTGGIGEALVLPDGRILSCSYDQTLRLWDKSGQPLSILEGHSDWVTRALALANGRILSWSNDGTLRIWDRSGKPLTVLVGHTSMVKGALTLPDGRILSWSNDETLRIWDQDGKPLAVLEGHTREVSGALELSGGRVLSWSRDSTLRLWDKSGQPLSILEGHTDRVTRALVLSDGRILSSSLDTLRLWDRDGKPLTVLGHGVAGALELPDGRILSWSFDQDPKVWDRDGKPLAGPRSQILEALALSDVRILTWSEAGAYNPQRPMYLWDSDWDLLAKLEGHTSSVSGALMLSDGRIISWSWDKTLRLWDQSGKPLNVLEGHNNKVEGALELSDRRILSWSEDKTIRLWDKDGKPMKVYGLDEGLRLYPEAKRAFYGPNRVYGTAYLTEKDNSAILACDLWPAIIWHGASACTARLLYPDGRAVVTQANGQVCFLQLYYDSRPITLDDLEALAPAGTGINDTAEPPGQSTPEIRDQIQPGEGETALNLNGTEISPPKRWWKFWQK